MGTPSTKPRQPSLTELVLMGEAAGEGIEGIGKAFDTMLVRSRKRKLPLDRVVSQPHQYSAFDRDDLLPFYYKQPQELRDQVYQMIQERSDPKYQPEWPDVDHYLTQSLYDRRFEHGVPKWIQKMEHVGTVGNHVFLREPSKKWKQGTR